MNFKEKKDALEKNIFEALPELMSEKVVLLDLPYHLNIGDTLIWQGEEDFLKSISKKVVYRASKDTIVEKNYGPDVTILLHGGGNFGDVWREHQEHRLEIIKRYPNNRIIILPQTIYYEDTAQATADFEILSNHSDLIICARDAVSYEIAKNHFTGTILMLPDMAFCIRTEKWPQVTKKHTQKLHMVRNDKELGVPAQNIPHEECVESDWPSYSCNTLIIRAYNKLLALHKKNQRSVVYRGLVDFYSQKILRPYLVKMGVQYIGAYNEVYLTRLHGQITAILLGIRSHFIDNSYGKNSQFYTTWLSDLDEVTLIANKETK